MQDNIFYLCMLYVLCVYIIGMEIQRNILIILTSYILGVVELYSKSLSMWNSREKSKIVYGQNKNTVVTD